METLLEEIQAATGSDARLVWVDEDFLVASGVQPWSDLPLWLTPSAHPELAGFLAMSNENALAASLRFRPIGETVRDTLEVWGSRAAASRK